MKCDRPEESKQLEAQLQSLSSEIWSLAKDCHGESQLLLYLLRTIEHWHQEIREDLFQESLPTTRKELYELLKEIEETGGWPYIERMKLKEFLARQELD